MVTLDIDARRAALDAEERELRRIVEAPARMAEIRRELTTLDAVERRRRAEALADAADPTWRAKLADAEAAYAHAAEVVRIHQRRRLRAAHVEPLRTEDRAFPPGLVWLDGPDLDQQIAERNEMAAQRLVRRLRSYPNEVAAWHDASFQGANGAPQAPAVVVRQIAQELAHPQKPDGRTEAAGFGPAEAMADTVAEVRRTARPMPEPDPRSAPSALLDL